MDEEIRYPWSFHGETVEVDTPEQTRIELRIAPFGSRLAAALFDRLIVLIGGLIFFFAALIAGVSFAGGYAVAIGVAVFFLASQFFFVVCEMQMEGRTPGKRMAGLRTVQLSGHGLTLGASVVRNLARIVDELPIAWIVPAVTKGRRRIGDILAGTVVIAEDKKASVKRDRARGQWLTRLAPKYSELEERRFPFPASAAEQLFRDDLDLIEYLETRLRALPPARRRKMLREIAEKYVERIGLGDDVERIRDDAERFLQELGLFLRARFDEAVY